MHNSETIRIKYFMDLLMAKDRPVMLVGGAGTGKSVMVLNKLNSLDEESYVVSNVPFNFYTTSALLQSKTIICFSHLIRLLYASMFLVVERQLLNWVFMRLYIR